MIRWAVVFLLIAIVSAIIGFTALAENEAFIAKLVFFVFTVLFAAGFVLGASIGKKHARNHSHSVRHK